MSKLEELINELCPDGVEYRTLGELGSFYGGLTGKSKNDFKDGNAAFISYRNVYSNPALDIHPLEKVKISEGEKQRTLEYGDIIFTGSSETPDECGFSSVVTEKPEESLYLNSFCFFYRFHNTGIMIPDFAKHLFRSHNLRYQIGKTASGVTRFNVSKEKMAKISIPVPPLEVQREIVRILDNFTELTAELTAELKCREDIFKEVIDSYFDSQDRGNVIKLRNVTQNENRKNINQTIKLAYSITQRGLIPTSEYFGETKITSDDTSGYKIVDPGWFVYSPSRIDVGSINYHKGKETVIVSPLNVVFSINNSVIDADYLLYYLKSHRGMFYILSKRIGIEGTGRKLLPYDSFSEIVMAIPTVNEQKAVVARFQAIQEYNELLVKEIEARQKQYEYYRDKLLTFKELKQ